MKCKCCGKKGFFLVTNKDGLCQECEAAEAEHQARELELRTWRPRSYDLRMNEWYLMYSYHNVAVSMSISGLYHGYADFIVINNSVSVIFDGKAVGTISNSQKSDMISDFLSRGEKILAQFDSESSLYIGFYKKLLDSVNAWAQITYPIIKTTKKDSAFDTPRWENWEGTNDGDILNMEYDDDSETYIVYDNVGSELGEISKANSQKLFNIIDEASHYHAFMAERSTYGDNDRPSGSIIIYYK